jgi:hypothetical protein
VEAQTPPLLWGMEIRENRPPPDFARLRRGIPLVFFTTRSGAPKRSDGGLELELVLEGDDESAHESNLGRHGGRPSPELNDRCCLNGEIIGPPI